MAKRMRQWMAVIVLIPLGLGGLSLRGGAEESTGPHSELVSFLSQKKWQRAQVAVHAIDLETGEVVFTHNADLLLNPASNAKIVTTFCALDELGPTFQFETPLYSETPLAEGSIKNLWVRGGGDPSLTSERLWKMANELYQIGLKEIGGDIIIDDTFFDSRDFPGLSDFFEATDPLRLGAFSVNFNTVTVHVRGGPAPGQAAFVSTEPFRGYPPLQNDAMTVGGSNTPQVNVAMTIDNEERILVRGRVPIRGPALTSYRGVYNPALYAGLALKGVLEQHGISVRGEVKAAPRPSGLKLIHVYLSPTLSEVARDMGKYSNNFTAEQILKALGGIQFGAPASSAKGLKVIARCLQKHGIPSGTYTLENGSGLSRNTRMTSRQLVTLLSLARSNHEFGPEFLSSLSLGGIDGTIRRRFKSSEIRGRVRGKTGSLKEVEALSGYLETFKGRRVAFSILINGSFQPPIERIVLELAKS